MLDELLGLQKPQAQGKAHDAMLFIVMHHCGYCQSLAAGGFWYPAFVNDPANAGAPGLKCGPS